MFHLSRHIARQLGFAGAALLVACADDASTVSNVTGSSPVGAGGTSTLQSGIAGQSGVAGSYLSSGAGVPSVAGSGGASTTAGTTQGGFGGASSAAGHGGASGASTAGVGGALNSAGSGGAHAGSAGAGGSPSTAGSSGAPSTDPPVVTSASYPNGFQVRQGYGAFVISYVGTGFNQLTGASASGHEATLSIQSDVSASVVVEIEHGAPQGQVDIMLLSNSPDSYGSNIIVTNITASDAGDDTGNGTPDHPFRTYQHALSVTGVGDTVDLDGAFQIDDGFEGATKATIPDRVTIEGSDDGQTVLTCKEPFTAFAASGSIVVRNLTTERCNGVETVGTPGTVTVRNVAIHGAPNGAYSFEAIAGPGVPLALFADIGVAPPPPGGVAPPCEISGGESGIYLGAGSLTVTGCSIHDNNQEGLVSWSQVLLDAVSVTSNGLNAHEGPFCGVRTMLGDLTIQNSTISDNGGCGVNLSGAAGHLRSSSITGNCVQGTDPESCAGVRFHGYPTDLDAVVMKSNRFGGLSVVGGVSLTATGSCAFGDNQYGVYVAAAPPDGGDLPIDLGNSTFDSNSIAGIYDAGAPWTLTVGPADGTDDAANNRATFTNNGTVGSPIAAGIWLDGASAESVHVRNVDFQQNAAGLVVAGSGAATVDASSVRFVGNAGAGVYLTNPVAILDIGDSPSGGSALGVLFAGNGLSAASSTQGQVADYRVSSPTREAAVRASFADAVGGVERVYDLDVVGPTTSETTNPSPADVHIEFGASLSLQAGDWF